MDRSFFAQLCYFDQSFSSSQQSFHIFSRDEILAEPLKWLKTLLMVRVGLVSAEKLQTYSYPQRYTMAQLDTARERCHVMADGASATGKDFMIVFKAVPKDQVGLIRNFRAYSAADIDSTLDQIKGLYETTDRQLWFCFSLVDPKTLSLGGRLTLPRNTLPDEVELVWYTSPRRIDEFSGADFIFPFWRGHRDVGQFAFHTNLLHVPDIHLTDPHPSSDSYLQDVYFVIRNLWRYSVAIRSLCTILYAAGANEVVLEFKVESGLVSFIDWDTDQELFR